MIKIKKMFRRHKCRVGGSIYKLKKKKANIETLFKNKKVIQAISNDACESAAALPVCMECLLASELLFFFLASFIESSFTSLMGAVTFLTAFRRVVRVDRVGISSLELSSCVISLCTFWRVDR